MMNGKTAVITGGSRGIGAACAKVLAKRGANIVLVDVLDCEPLKEEILNENPQVKVLIKNVDVRKRDQVENALKETAEVFKTIDILINNAGTGARVSLKDITDEIWEKDIETNLKGTFLFTQSAIYPYMINQGEGRIINISSISGIVGGAISYENGKRTGRSGPAYAASKGGIIAFTKWVAKEVGEYGICCNSIAPGYIETELTKNANYPLDDQVIKRAGTPEDIAEAVVYLASPAAGYVTGEVLKVCGGRAIG